MPGAIESRRNPESAALVGGNFPDDDETTFAASAAEERAKADELDDLASTTDRERSATAESLEGASGDAAADEMGRSSGELREEADKHRNLAETMDAGGRNVAQTKANINAIDDDYHARIADIEAAHASGELTDEQYQVARAQALVTSQEAIAAQRAGLDSSQDSLVTAAAAGRATPTDAVVAALPAAAGVVGNALVGFSNAASSPSSGAGYGMPAGAGYGMPAGSGFGAAGYGAPGFGAPGYGAPGFGAPGYGTPGFGAPGFGAPGYGAPGFGAPGFGSPAGYGAPGYGAPGYGSPAGYAAPGATGAPAGSPVGGLGYQTGQFLGQIYSGLTGQPVPGATPGTMPGTAGGAPAPGAPAPGAGAGAGAPQPQVTPTGTDTGRPSDLLRRIGDAISSPASAHLHADADGFDASVRHGDDSASVSARDGHVDAQASRGGEPAAGGPAGHSGSAAGPSGPAGDGGAAAAPGPDADAPGPGGEGAAGDGADSGGAIGDSPDTAGEPAPAPAGEGGEPAATESGDEPVLAGSDPAAPSDGEPGRGSEHVETALSSAAPSAAAPTSLSSSVPGAAASAAPGVAGGFGPAMPAAGAAGFAPGAGTSAPQSPGLAPSGAAGTAREASGAPRESAGLDVRPRPGAAASGGRNRGDDAGAPAEVRVDGGTVTALPPMCAGDEAVAGRDPVRAGGLLRAARLREDMLDGGRIVGAAVASFTDGERAYFVAATDVGWCVLPGTMVLPDGVMPITDAGGFDDLDFNDLGGSPASDKLAALAKTDHGMGRLVAIDVAARPGTVAGEEVLRAGRVSRELPAGTLPAAGGPAALEQAATIVTDAPSSMPAQLLYRVAESAKGPEAVTEAVRDFLVAAMREEMEQGNVSRVLYLVDQWNAIP